MYQVLHIFKKDVRRLWPQISVLISLAAAFCWLDTRESTAFLHAPETSYLAISILLYAVVWYLVSAAVHNESPVEERDYWITRPIGWGRLLAAKALFVVVTVHAPLLLADSLILTLQGFSPLEHIPGLLWRQGVLGVFCVFPAAALAAVTRTFAQLVFASFVLASALVALDLTQWDASLYWGPLLWFKPWLASLVVLPAAILVVLLQYTRRRTIISRIVAASTLLVAVLLYTLVPWETAFAVQSSLSTEDVPDAVVRISLADVPPKPARSLAGGVAPWLSLPLRISGMPERSGVVVERITLTFVAPDGVSHRHTMPERWITYSRDGVYWRPVSIREPLLENVKQGTVSAKVSLFVTLYGNLKISRGAALDDPSVLPDGALCSPDSDGAAGQLILSCRSPLRGPSRSMARLQYRGSGAIRESELHGWSSFSPFPSDLRLSPVARDVARFTLRSVIPRSGLPNLRQPTLRDCDVVYETWEPVAHFRRTFEIAGNKLADYLR